MAFSSCCHLKSRVRRGGMTAKVKSTVYSSQASILVVIINGYATGSILRALNGERIGTLFHRDAYKWVQVKEVGEHEVAIAAGESSRRLQAMFSQDKKKILLVIAVEASCPW